MIARSTLFDAENVFRLLSVRVPRPMEENVLQKIILGCCQTTGRGACSDSGLRLQGHFKKLNTIQHSTCST